MSEQLAGGQIKGQPSSLGVNPTTQVERGTAIFKKCLPCLPPQRERECGGMLVGPFYSPGLEAVHITSAYIYCLTPVTQPHQTAVEARKCGPIVSPRKRQRHVGEKLTSLFHTALFQNSGSRVAILKLRKKFLLQKSSC